MERMFEVTTFYKFVWLADLEVLRERLENAGRQLGLCGTILLADEGINATVAAEGGNLDVFMEKLRAILEFSGIAEKRSTSGKPPFYRFKVRIKKEIVTLGAGVLDPAHNAGQYVAAKNWNALIAEEGVVVIDTRNRYETAIGKFRGAIDPETDTFGEFPQWVKTHLDPEKTPKVAMYCTGGIRCEKATALLKREGFSEVYHLEGGILKYLETVSEQESLWEGDCFVFDGRVGLAHGLSEGNHVFCAGCRYPLAPEDLQHPEYEEGVACGRCSADAEETTKAGRRERQRQIRLAAARGEPHLGRIFRPVV